MLESRLKDNSLQPTCDVQSFGNAKVILIERN